MCHKERGREREIKRKSSKGTQTRTGRLTENQRGKGIRKI